MNILQSIISFCKNREIYTPIVSIIIGLFSYKLINSGLKKMVKKGKDPYDTKKRRTILDLISNVAKYIIVVIVGIIILEVYGFDTASIITGLGVVSAVIGLAFQDTLKDFISGITIILENYYIVGDMVKYNDFTGEIINLGLKSTKIKNYNGEVLILANRNISEVINLSQSKQNITLTIPIAYEEKVSKVEKVITNTFSKIDSIPNVKKGATEFLGIEQLDSSSVNYLIKITCTQDKQWAVKRQALKIIKHELDINDVKIPYQQIEVHNGKDI